MTTVMDIRRALNEFARRAVCNPDTLRIQSKVLAEVLGSCTMGEFNRTFDCKATLCGMVVELDETVDGFSISAESRCSYCRGGKAVNERWCTACEIRRTMGSNYYPPPVSVWTFDS